MAKRKKHEEHEGHANHERWVLSYADILTLLLALFIVMFAISKVDQKKFEEFARGTAQSFGQANLAMQGQTGNLPGTDGILEDATGQEAKSPADTPADNAPMGNQEALQRERARQAQAEAQKASLEQLKKEIEAKLRQKGLAQSVQMEVDERGLVVNIVTDKVLFDNGKADLRTDGTQVLDLIAPIVKSLPNTITVEGHTDNVPISGTFPSNWELSTTRATTVLRHLVSHGVPAKRISAAGYADQRPLGSNRTAAGKARNRRVAIVVLPLVSLTGTGVPVSEAPAAAPPAGDVPAAAPRAAKPAGASGAANSAGH